MIFTVPAYHFRLFPRMLEAHDLVAEFTSLAPSSSLLHPTNFPLLFFFFFAGESESDSDSDSASASVHAESDSSGVLIRSQLDSARLLPTLSTPVFTQTFLDDFGLGITT